MKEFMECKTDPEIRRTLAHERGFPDKAIVNSLSLKKQNKTIWQFYYGNKIFEWTVGAEDKAENLKIRNMEKANG